MKKFIFLIFILSFQKDLIAAVENKIIIKIENQIITSFDIKNKIKSSLVLSNQELSQNNIDKIKSQALDSLINLNLKKNEVSKYSIKENRTQINNYLNSISSNDISSLKEKFKLNDIDFDIFLDEVKIELKWRNLIINKFNDKIKIDQGFVEKEIQQIIKQQKDVIEYKISEIEILSKNDETDKKKVLEINKQIKDIGFEATAITQSISSSASNKGDLGWINANSLSKKFSDKVIKLKVNEVSEPIYTQNSIVILKLTNKRSIKKNEINIDNLRKNIINQKKNELFNLYSRSFLSKIKNTSFIEFK